MSDTGKQSPLGVNVNNSLLATEGLQINPKFTSWVGSSRNFGDYAFGRVCQETVLRVLTHAIHEGYVGNPDGRMYKGTYDNLINIGNGTTRVSISSIVSGQLPGFDRYYFDVTYTGNVVVTAGEYIRISGASPSGYNGNWIISEILGSKKFRIYSTAFYGPASAPGIFAVDSQVPGLGNAKPGVYSWERPNAPYGTGAFNLGGDIGWGGNTYQDVNPATQWAYIRLLALQAWMEFNYNSTLEQGSIENPTGYRDFLQSFQNAYGFISYSNDAILSIDNSKDFLDGTFSNMNDLITADITNVTLALKDWGQDLIRLGKALDLSLIEYFGLPSALLKTLAKYNAINRNLSLAIIASGIPTNELGNILGNISQPTIEQERKLYASFVLTVGDTLQEILISLNCKTTGLESLADLLDPKKLFPNSYKSLTVPLYRDSNTPLTTVTTTIPGSNTTTTNPSVTTTETVTYTWQGPTTGSTGSYSINQATLTALKLSPETVAANGNKYILNNTISGGVNWSYEPVLTQTGGAPWILDGVTYPEYGQALSSARGWIILPPAVKKLTVQIINTGMTNPRAVFRLGSQASGSELASPSLANLYEGKNILVDSSENNQGIKYNLLLNQPIDPSNNNFSYLSVNLSFDQTFNYGFISTTSLYIEAEVDMQLYKLWYNNLPRSNEVEVQLKTFDATQTTTTPGDNNGGGTDTTVVTTNLSNSKISYLLYNQDGGVNSQLTSTQVVNAVGIQTLPGSPLISEVPIGQDITIQEPVKGFGSYLATIVPPSIAVTAGAFATSVKQIKNIKEVPVEKFAQVVTNLETMAVTNQNGTQTTLNTNQGTPNNVPTNLNLRTRARPLVALGSGPQGSYTASDFFGCMSGLPYNGSSANPQLGIPEWGLEGIYNKLKELATRKLFNIYHELYLAVTWQRATTYISQNVFNEMVQPYIRNNDNPAYDPNPTEPNPAFDPNLPPGPGNEPTEPNPKYDPYLYLNAATGAKTNEKHFQPRIDNWFYTVNFGVGSSGGGYGRGSAPPPDIRLFPNNCRGSISVGVGYDDNAIPGVFGRVFETGKSFGSKYLYATTSVFQSAPPPKPTPPEEFLYIQGPPTGGYPVQANGNFYPNGANNDPGFLAGSQSGGNPGYNAWHAIESVIQGYINQANEEINAINQAQRPSCIKLNNYWNSTGYQLTIEQRARMMGLRPPLPDTRENFLSLWPTTMYTFTDSLPNYGKNTEPHMYAQTIENIANWDTVGGQSMVAMMRQDRNQARLSALGIELDNNIPDKLPYDQQKVLIANGTLPIGGSNPNIPAGAITAPPNTPYTPPTTTPSSPVIIRDRTPVTPVQAGTINVGTGEYIIVNPVYDNGGGVDGVIDNGDGIVPGSFAGSPYTNLISPNLNSWYSSHTLIPSTYTVNSAIEEVIRCNCDCWNLA